MKKLFVLVVVITMITTLFVSGCTPKTDNAEATKPTESKTTKEETETETEKEPETKEEPVTLVYHRSGGTDNAVDKDNPTYQHLIQYALDEANVKLEIELFDWGDTYNQKLTMYAAGGDLPSGVWTLGGVLNAFATEIINEMGMNGMLYDWTEVVYDTATYPNLLANAEETFIKMAINKADGKLYGLPAERHGSYPHAPGGITIRKDWLLESGLDFPTNEAELYEIIVKFSETYQTSSGKPITPVSFPVWSNFTFWLNSWLGTSMWYKNADGSYDYGMYAKQDQLKAALVFLNKLDREGLLDKESFTHKNEQFVEKGINGSFGVTTFDWTPIYSINDAFYATNPDSDMFFVSAKTFSAYDGLSAENVNSCEITSVPFNRTVITTNGIDEDTFLKLIKAIDWLGGYEVSRTFLMGFEGDEWEYENGDGRIIRTEAYNEKVAEKSSYQYNAGLCYWSSINSNIGAMYDLLNAICTRKSDLESVANIAGHQIAISDGINIVTSGEVETEKWQLIKDAWRQMVIAAIGAATEAECIAVVDAWPTQLEQLGYKEVVAERTAIVESFGIE